MSFTDNELNERKSKLRIEALEKEVHRLRNSTHKQSGKISTLRKSLYLQLVFFVSLLSILLFKGLIQLPNSTSAVNKLPNIAEVKESPVQDTLSNVNITETDTISQIAQNTIEEVLVDENQDGIIFAIQIGAYASIDLSDYEENLSGIKQDTYDGINQFTLGEFNEYYKAESFLKVVQQMGFKDAFVMSFKDGKRIHIQNALAMRLKNLPDEREVAENKPLSKIVDSSPNQTPVGIEASSNDNRIQL